MNKMSSNIKKVVLVGANGTLGPAILQSLLDTKSFEVSVLNRKSSKSKYPSEVAILETDDDLPHDQLVSALKDQDALVMCFNGTKKEAFTKLSNAAFEAGIKHIIPADFGSCDSSDERSLSLIPLYVNKKDIRDRLIELNDRKRENGSFMSWTSLITGHFFDYGLKSGLLNIDLEKGTARIYDNGDAKWAASTLATIGDATARVLQHSEHPRIKNKLVFIQGVQGTQNDLVKAVEVTTGKKLQLERVSADEFIKKNKQILDNDPGNHEITEELVAVEGTVNTNWDDKGEAYVNDLLEIPLGNLQEMVREALK